MSHKGFLFAEGYFPFCIPVAEAWDQSTYYPDFSLVGEPSHLSTSFIPVCGPGTAYPFKMSLEKLSQLFWRTKYIKARATLNNGDKTISFIFTIGVDAHYMALDYFDDPVAGTGHHFTESSTASEVGNVQDIYKLLAPGTGALEGGISYDVTVNLSTDPDLTIIIPTSKDIAAASSPSAPVGVFASFEATGYPTGDVSSSDQVGCSVQIFPISGGRPQIVQDADGNLYPGFQFASGLASTLRKKDDGYSNNADATLLGESFKIYHNITGGDVSFSTDPTPFRYFTCGGIYDPNSGALV